MTKDLLTKKCTYHEACLHEGTERSIKNHVAYWKKLHAYEESTRPSKRKWWEFWK